MADALQTQALQDEFARRFGRAGVSAAILAGLFPQQLALVNDPARRKAALCGRRAGKTTGMGSYLVKVAEENPECVVVYIALSRSSAKRLMWPILRRLNRKLYVNKGLAEIEFNNTDLTATFPNGSQVWLTGANDEDDIDKLRGDKYKLVVIDECASFGQHLAALIEEVLDPAVAEVDGTIVMTGSPSVICVGPFYTATTATGGEWSRHHWTMLDNPMYEAWKGKPDWRERAKAALAAKRASKGWSETNPIYIREWMGEWVASDAGLVYHFDKDKNTYTRLPTGWEFSDFHYILGLDLGYRDPTAFVVCAYAEDLPDLYVVEEFSKPGMIPSEIEAKIRELDSHYHFIRMVADTGGLGKSIVEGFTRKGLPLIAAEKTRKFEFIELMNGDMADGHIKAPPGSELVKQWKSVRLVDSRSGEPEDEKARGGMGYRPKENDADPNDLVDACLYAFREAYHWLYRAPPPPPPPVDSLDWYKHEAARMRKDALDRADRRKRRNEDVLWEEKS